MEEGWFLLPLASHYEVSAMILRYLEPGDLIKLLLLNHSTRNLLLSSQMNYFWFTEIQLLPRGYHVHEPAKRDDEPPCKHSALRLQMRNLMAKALVTPVYCNWLHHLKCRNWDHYKELPAYDSYWQLHKRKPHHFQAEKKYFENWKKKIYIRMVWWNGAEHVSDWLNRQKSLLLVKYQNWIRTNRTKTESFYSLQYEIDQLNDIKDRQMPRLIAKVTACEEKYKKGIVSYQRKNPPWVSKRFNRVYYRR
jgi:hypothetical protein